MTRTGKIARLPLALREQLNRRLQDGEIGRDLVVWLNAAPEVQGVLKAEFGERPLNEQNLSDWKTGGYEDWLAHQETMAQVNQLVANAKELGGSSDTPLSELLTTCLTARYVVELSHLTAKAEGNGGCDLEVLHKLCRDVLALRRLDLAAQRWRIEREAADREMRKDEEERKEKLLKDEQHHQILKRARQATRAAGYHLPFDPRFDDEADMQKEVAVAELRRERDKLAAVHDKMKKDFERQQEYDQELEELEQAEEEKLAREGKTAKEEPEEEQSAGKPEAAGAVAAGQPAGAQGEQVGPQGEQVGGSQSSPLRKQRLKAEAQGAVGQSTKDKSRQLKRTQGKSGKAKAGSVAETSAKIVREAKILMGTLPEGE